MMGDKVKCNGCGWQWTEDELEPFAEDGQFGDGVF